jgi:hypothetical protein
MVSIGAISKQRRDELLDICGRLLEEVSLPVPDKKKIGGIVGEFKSRTGLDNAQLAELFDVSVQTLYRWMKSDGSIPRKGHITHVMEVISSEVARPLMEEPQEVRVGVSKFWDMALITGFELAFAAFAIKPKFYQLDAWHEDAHEAFVHNEIDIAVHNHFTQLYDDKHPRKLDLDLRYPLFSYQGHHIFVARDYLSQFKDNPIIAALSSGRLDGLKPAADKDHKELLADLLDGAHIGVERGTDLELAFRRAFTLAETKFPDLRSRKINCKRTGEPLNGFDQNPYLVTTDEAFEAFKANEVEMFCGGWQQFYSLYKEQTPVLLAPFELNVKSFNGLVATKEFAEANEPMLESIAQIWFCGINRFREWGSNPKGLNDSQRRQAVAELRAILAAGETYTGTRNEILGEDVSTCILRIMKNQECLDGGEDSVRTSVERALAERDEQILQWAALLCKYDAFYPSLLEAKAAFTDWWADEEVQRLWNETKMDHVKGVHYVN